MSFYRKQCTMLSFIFPYLSFPLTLKYTFVCIYSLKTIAELGSIEQ